MTEVPKLSQALEPSGGVLKHTSLGPTLEFLTQ